MKLAQSCASCPLAATRKRIVWGEGPHPARIMLLGQNPGIAEDRSGTPFVGPSGKELEHILWRMGIRREDVYITNTTKCRGKDDADLDPAWVATCTSKYLLREIELVRPDLIVALGAVAAHWLIGDTHPRQMELLHGFLYQSTNPDIGTVNVLPAYHPAAGLHNPSLLAQCQWDLAHIKPALYGELPYGPRVGPQPTTMDYRIARIKRDINEMLEPDDLGVVAIDTETTEGDRPWCITATTRPGTAVMVMAKDTDLTVHFGQHIRALDLAPVIHNAIFDIPVLGQMGVAVDMERLQDTLEMAYLLQFLPKGLKPLAYRLAGVQMASYTETTQPARYAKAMDYLRKAGQMEWPDPESLIEVKADGTPHVKRPQNIAKKIQRALLDVEKGRLDEPWTRWRTMDGTDVVESVLGPMPDGWLSDLPLDEAVGYACQDSDMTRRIYIPLKRLCEERGLL